LIVYKSCWWKIPSFHLSWHERTKYKAKTLDIPNNPKKCKKKYEEKKNHYFVFEGRTLSKFEALVTRLIVNTKSLILFFKW
jgi:hypothetical protein